MRAVLDPNVLISALLSPHGAPARILLSWLLGEFELIVCPRLLDEVERALGYPKLRRRIDPEDTRRFVDLIAARAVSAPDPEDPPSVRSRDPDDDYLIALAAQERAVIVSGDGHLLNLEGEIPVFTPASFLERFSHSP